MIKSELLYSSPIIFNIMMIFIMMTPSKNFKFHPIMLLLILMSLVMMICFKMFFLFNSWTAFILFLMMIGGLMVIYMYITSLANNDLFNFKFKLIYLNMNKIFPFLLMYFILIYFNKYYFFMNSNFYDFWLNYNQFINFKMNLSYMYTKFNFYSSIFLMMYLYFSMICVMNICYKFKSPLRQLLF